MGPRGQNEEADALTNAEFSAFDPRLRVDVGLKGMRWMTMDKLMAVAKDIYEDVRARRGKRRAEPGTEGARPAAGRPRKRLREVDPW